MVGVREAITSVTTGPDSVRPAMVPVLLALSSQDSDRNLKGTKMPRNLANNSMAERNKSPTNSSHITAQRKHYGT